METGSYKIRRRTNISTSVKGIKTPDYTVETVDMTLEEHMQEFSKLAKEMEAMYPVKEV